MDRHELKEKLPIKKIDRVIARAKERGVIGNRRITDFTDDEANEIIGYEWERYNDLVRKGMRADGSFEHANKGISRTREQKQKYREGSLGNKNAEGSHKISSETRKGWSELRRGKKPWNYNQYLHEVISKSGYSAQTVRKYGWTLENCKQKDFGVSAGEDEIYRYVVSLCGEGEAVQDTRKIIPPKELDVYVPSKKVAIEYNGLYWHSEAHVTDKYYHLEKTRMAESKGIRLIQLYSDEWAEKKDICKSIIASALGIYERRIYARLCSVREVGKDESRAFFEENHIKGNGGSFRALGLYYNDELVMCASFRKEFVNSTNGKCVELSRMATKLNTQVIGGFSRIMSHANYRYVESFVDYRLFSGGGYDSANWHRMRNTRVGYYYTDGVRRYGRLSFMKKSCLKKWQDCDPAKSERQLCAEHGLYRIYDCGNIKMYWLSEGQ